MKPRTRKQKRNQAIRILFISLMAMAAMATIVSAKSVNVAEERVQNYDGDLVLKKIEIDKSAFEEGETVRVKVRIRNTGDKNLKNVRWAFYNNGYPTGAGATEVIEGMVDLNSNKEETVLVTFSMPTSSKGTPDSFAALFSLDPDNRVRERSEENNLRGKTILLTRAPEKQEIVYLPQETEEMKKEVKAPENQKKVHLRFPNPDAHYNRLESRDLHSHHLLHT